MKDLTSGTVRPRNQGEGKGEFVRTEEEDAASRSLMGAGRQMLSIGYSIL